jgi:hypothetical protein
VDVSIDDDGAFSNDWNHHINLLSTIFHRLRKKIFTINPLNMNRPSKKLTGVVTGLLNIVLSLGKRKLIPSFIWIVLTMPQNFACSLVA